MVDFSKFDTSKMFDMDNIISAVEKNNNTLLGYITDAKVKTVAETVSAASFDFVRAQAAAARAYGQAVKSAFGV